jgi:hypothetical protein
MTYSSLVLAFQASRDQIGGTDENRYVVTNRAEHGFTYEVLTEKEFWACTSRVSIVRVRARDFKCSFTLACMVKIAEAAERRYA